MACSSLVLMLYLWLWLRSFAVILFFAVQLELLRSAPLLGASPAWIAANAVLCSPAIHDLWSAVRKQSFPPYISDNEENMKSIFTTVTTKGARQAMVAILIETIFKAPMSSQKLDHPGFDIFNEPVCPSLFGCCIPTILPLVQTRLLFFAEYLAQFIYSFELKGHCIFKGA